VAATLTTLTSHGVILAALLLIAGALGDRFGRRPAPLAGLALLGVPK
jgi:MFS family permease